MAVPQPEFSKNDLAILKTGRAAKAFLEGDFGKYFMGLLREALERKRLEYEQPASSGVDGVSQVLRAESAKGAIMGLRLALEIPAGMVTEMEALRSAKGLGTAGEDE